ncbi:psbP-like protein 1, chloroplastic isoform X2 [Asparagus officinalis]|uniref:psbP-like protein 1, chloroplastic isoform X2 n=1 Tax=Asparagus officinalis TaxID=4686 RepID=UPI00098E78A4|nr:psbP-like protein 1, chloroplastic isoform X2 [Asparagus officinalis]
MATSLQNSPASLHRALSSSASPHQGPAPFLGHGRKRAVQFQAKAAASEALPSLEHERTGRRQAFISGAIATCVSIFPFNSKAFAAEGKKGFQVVLDKKDGYSFLYPFGWQEVFIQGQDKVFKDVIEPLESVSVNMIETKKKDIRDLGSPQEVAEALIKKVLAPSTQKTKLVEASEHEVDGKSYYSFEFIAQAPNFTRHALSTICIANGKFYTLTTGANERRWGKMKDKLHTVIDSFKVSA